MSEITETDDFDKEARAKLKEWVLGFAKSKEIGVKARKGFFDLVDKLEGKSKGATSEEMNGEMQLETEEDGEKLKNGSEESPNHDLQEPNAKESKSKDGRISKEGLVENEDEEDAIMDLVDAQDDQNLIFEEEEEEELNEENIRDLDVIDELGEDELIEYLIPQQEDNEEDAELEDDEWNPLKNMTFEEFKKKMPPYFLKTKKQKKKFFKKMNQDYFNMMNGEIKRKISKKSHSVKFLMDKTQVRKFKKNQKIL